MTAVAESLDRIRNQGRLSHAMLNESNKAQLQSSEISLQRAFSQLQVTNMGSLAPSQWAEMFSGSGLHGFSHASCSLQIE